MQIISEIIITNWQKIQFQIAKEREKYSFERKKECDNVNDCALALGLVALMANAHLHISLCMIMIREPARGVCICGDYGYLYKQLSLLL